MTLHDLWYSTQDLFKRFNLKPSTDAQMRKFFEEVYEFSKEVNQNREKEKIVQELVDVIVVGMAVCQNLGVSYDDLDNAVWYVIEKNNAKNLNTHEVKNDMIVRKNNGSS